MKTEIRIVIADDHPIFRQGLRTVIETDSRLQIVAESEDGEVALEQIEMFRPEIAILDMEMPNKGGFEVMQAIQEKKLPVAVIFLTMHKDQRFFNAALDRGARGYVLKESAVADIIAGIKAVGAGQNFISPQLSTYLLNRHARATSLINENSGLNDLTPTERQVVRLIAANKTSREIAAELFISVQKASCEHQREAGVARQSRITQLCPRGTNSFPVRFAVRRCFTRS